MITSGGDSVKTSPITRAHDQTFLFGETNGLRGDAVPRIECALGGFVGNELDAADQTEAARFTDQRMVTEELEPRLEQGRAPGAPWR